MYVNGLFLEKKGRKVKKKSKSRSRSKKSSEKDKSEIDPIIKLKTIRENQKDIRKISDLDDISSNTRGTRRKAQVFRQSDRGSVKSRWGDLQEMQNNRSRQTSNKDSEKSNFTSSHEAADSSFRNTNDSLSLPENG